jgi:sterol desaturase/sphingolipid hydroxylase (fatty acid hydroxylase superfamily)
MKTFYFLGTCLLLLLISVELIFFKLENKEIPWREIATNLNTGQIVLWIFRSLEIIAFVFIYRHMSFDLVGHLPIWLIWLSGFILWDFCFYWLHRLHHKYKIFWLIHQVHHQGEYFNLSLGVRNSWYSSLTSIPFFLPMALIGYSPESFIIIGALHYFIQFYNHNGIVRQSGFLEYIMITPSHHRVHHGRAEIYHNKNFGGTFVWWDKLFGTFQPEDRSLPEQYGVPGYSDHTDIIALNHDPAFKSTLNAQGEMVSIPGWVIFAGSMLLFFHLLYFIYFEKTLDGVYLAHLFFTIAIGTILLSRMPHVPLNRLNLNIIISICVFGLLRICNTVDFTLSALIHMYIIFCISLMIRYNYRWILSGTKN